MASRVNHESDYLFVVEGLTVWERLRCIRNFIEDRKSAIASGEIAKEEVEWRISVLSDTKPEIFEKRKLIAQQEVSASALQHAKEELEFLYELEEKLMALAEKDRVEGKTDEEMYEINHYKEHVARLVRKANCEYISIGSISPNTLESLFRTKEAMQIIYDQGILSQEKIEALTHTQRIKELPLCED